MKSKSNPPKNEFTPLRERAEKELQQKHKSQKKMSHADMQDLIHELQVHQIELEMQSEELHRANAELETARDKYSNLYDFAPVGYLSLDKNRLIIEANLTLSNMLQIPRSQLLGQSFTAFILPADQDIFYLNHRQLFDSRLSKSSELRLKKADGKHFWAQIQATILEGSSVPQSRLAISNITERKLAEEVSRWAEEALRESEERFSKAFRNSPTGMVISRIESGEILEVNEAFLRIFGFDRNETIGHTMMELNMIVNPEQRPDDIQRLPEKGTIRSEEFELRHKSGEVRQVLSSVETIELGGKICTISSIVDITERTKAQQQLKTQLDELQLWHDVTVGREGRVIELKEEVNQLLAELGKPKRYST